MFVFSIGKKHADGKYQQNTTESHGKSRIKIDILPQTDLRLNKLRLMCQSEIDGNTAEHHKYHYSYKESAGSLIPSLRKSSHTVRCGITASPGISSAVVIYIHTIPLLLFLHRCLNHIVIIFFTTFFILIFKISIRIGIRLLLSVIRCLSFIAQI